MKNNRIKDKWVFGVSSFSGNPKWLYLYIAKRHPEIKTWWLADTEKSAKAMVAAGLSRSKIIVRDTKRANDILRKIDVYVEDQFREYYPDALGGQVTYLNLWHGVGLKEIELNIPFNGSLAGTIMKKYSKNARKYHDQTLFLVTSGSMEEHFARSISTPRSQFLRGGYPRVSLPKNIQPLRTNLLSGKWSHIAMYAPTFRDWNSSNYLIELMPKIDELIAAVESSNTLFILNLHPKMRQDRQYVGILDKIKNHPNFICVDETIDVYEMMQSIDYTIVDYSSIYYDLMAAGADKFVRYIPDYEKYIQYQDGGMKDYREKTYGEVVTNFDELLQTVRNPRYTKMIDRKKKKELMEYFFGYAGNAEDDTEAIIRSVELFKPKPKEESALTTLRSYDVFDTLIKRSVGMPVGVFYAVRERMYKVQHEFQFPTYVLDNYPNVRRQAEADMRHHKHHTQIERKSDIREVTLQSILERMSEIYGLTDKQKRYLIETEISVEIETVQPIQSRIETLFGQQKKGDTIILVSDMYLPREVIKRMLIKADPRLAKLKLYLSSETGYQKSTGLLYKYIFSDIHYMFKEWVHYGDNQHSDKKIPSQLGITTQYHEMIPFNKHEAFIANTMNSSDGYKIANLMRLYRDTEEYDKKSDREKRLGYYSYAFIGSYLVPYVDWLLRDAVAKKTKRLYFITRDGNMLIEIARVLREARGYDIELSLIYGSRSVFRIPSFIDEIEDEAFAPFGFLQSIGSYKKFLKVAQVTDDQFDEFFSSASDLKYKNKYTQDEEVTLRSAASNSKEFREHILRIAAQKRPVILDYLRESINFDEKFAFAEFWGRGYTQASLQKLLSEASGSPVVLEMYYARSIYGSDNYNVRTRFTTSTRGLTFIETLFNQAPMETVRQYAYDNKGVAYPVVLEKDTHEMFSAFIEGVTVFAKAYSEIDFYDWRRNTRALFDAAVVYFHNRSNDEHLVDVFGPLANNLEINGKQEVYAPSIPMKQALFMSTKYLKRNTKAWNLSVARSSRGVRIVLAGRRQYEQQKRNLKQVMPNQYKAIRFIKRPIARRIKNVVKK